MPRACCQRTGGRMNYFPQEDGDREQEKTEQRFNWSVAAGAVILTAVSVGFGAWGLWRATEAGQTAAAEADLNIGGRITDRLDDMSGTLEDNGRTLEETRKLASGSQEHYEEILNTLTQIGEQLDAYENSLEEDSGEISGEIVTEAPVVSAEVYSRTDNSRESEEIHSAVSDLKTQISSLEEQARKAQEESSSLLKEIEKQQAEDSGRLGEAESRDSALQSDVRTVSDSIRTRYQTLKSDNEALSQSLTALKTSISGMIEEYETKDGARYQSLTALLSSTGAAITGSVDNHEEELRRLIAEGQSSMTAALENGTEEILVRQQESLAEVSERLTGLNDIQEQQRLEAAAFREAADDSFSIILEKTSHNEESILRQEEILTRQEESLGRMEERIGTGQAAAEQSLAELAESMEDLKNGFASVLLAESDSRKMLIAALRQKGVELSEDATFLEIRDGILSISAVESSAEKRGNGTEKTEAVSDADSTEKGSGGIAVNTGSTGKSSIREKNSDSYLNQSNVRQLLTP